VQKLSQKSDPRTEVEQIRQKGETERTQMEMQAEAKAATRTTGEDLLLGQVNERIAEIKAGNAKEITFAELKAMLAGTAMKVARRRN
jgi:hypothetical protein